mmetsp:Transcript_5513/g.16261  ORF Transcript_5513/g.16261 Transcript_5513/m.16261 type:complete len:226 (-) Transcript_5513:2771-3448(-)
MDATVSPPQPRMWESGAARSVGSTGSPQTTLKKRGASGSGTRNPSWRALAMIWPRKYQFARASGLFSLQSSSRISGAGKSPNSFRRNPSVSVESGTKVISWGHDATSCWSGFACTGRSTVRVEAVTCTTLYGWARSSTPSSSCGAPGLSPPPRSITMSPGLPDSWWVMEWSRLHRSSSRRRMSERISFRSRVARSLEVTLASWVWMDESSRSEQVGDEEDIGMCA